MKRATLGTIEGAGAMRSRRRSETSREYRGTFAFRREHEAAVLELLASRQIVEYHGLIDGSLRRLKVLVTDVSIETGIAYFKGQGEPYEAEGGAQVG